MPLRIGDVAPDFRANSTQGPIEFHRWIGDDWAILFSHPKDFTPVCTTELGYMARIAPEFARRGCKILGLSTDTLADHASWIADIEATQGAKVVYPLISDADLQVAKLYEMLHPNAVAGPRSVAENATIRSVILIGPDKKIKALMAYPMSSGRNFDELLRLLDSLQMTATRNVATPVNWKPGEDVIIPPAVSDADAKQLYPQGWQTVRPYLRYVRLAEAKVATGER